MHRVHDLKKIEALKIRIPRADAAYAVFAHQYCGVRIVDQVSRYIWKLRDDLAGDLGMAIGRDQHAEARRCSQCADKLPCIRQIPRPPHDTRMRGYSQELVHNGPCGVPGIGACALRLDPVPALAMKG